MFPELSGTAHEYQEGGGFGSFRFSDMGVLREKSLNFKAFYRFFRAFQAVAI